MSFDRAEKSFEFAAEVAKQIITLSSGGIGLTLLLRGDVKPTAMLWLTWGCFGAAIVFSIWELLALTGTLASSKTPISATSPNSQIPAWLMLIAFTAAILFLILWQSSLIS